jgi:membrane protease YdiL (CAAX protease family)
MTDPPKQDPLNPEASFDGEEPDFSGSNPLVPWDLDPTLLVSPLGVFERPPLVLEEPDYEGTSPLPGGPESEKPFMLPSGAEFQDSLLAPDAMNFMKPSPTAEAPASTEAPARTEVASTPSEPERPGRPLFQSFYQPPVRPPARIPNFGHLLILALIASLGSLCAGILTMTALHYKLFGISTFEKAEDNIYYTLISMLALYLISFLAALLIFPPLWHKGFFAGIQWNAGTALRLRGRMFGAACACFVLAMIDGLLLPGPSNAPIDKLFQTKLDAWLLFAFGVTFAPFFEEIVFRGFLLPAFSTAFDSVAEYYTGNPPRPLEPNGHPNWSTPAMVLSSIAVSIPFALMHADQTGHALGPFILLVCVSLVLCWARLSTRSLAASVMVHASYNFLLFSLMLLGTGGFQHLDKM